MTDNETGRLEPVEVRQQWPDERQDFTPWLAKNVQFVSKALGMDLELEGKEVAVGGYSADLVLKENSTGAVVVVENMYGQTDHDHLGKLITYAAGLKASYVVLLAETFRPEHRSALTWLNTISTEDCGFFGLGLELWSIGDSLNAPLLRVDVQPDDWSKSVSGSKGDNPLQALRRRFWARVQADFREHGRDWAGKGQASREAWMVFKTRRGVKFVVAFCRVDGHPHFRCEAYVDTGDKQSTSDLYKELASRRSEIEKTFGEELEWSELEDKRACRISFYLPETMEVEDEDRWGEVSKWAVSTLDRLRSAIEPVLDDI